MPSLTDAALLAEVAAAARGDRDAFGRLVAATSGLVTAITLAEARDAEVARDAAQDIYLQVWNGLAQLRRPESFLPWLRQAARRQARRLRLQHGRRTRGEAAERALDEAVSPGPGPGERLLDAELAALVRAALEALPDEARETVLLYYREGHSSAQVARLLGLSEAAVQQRLSRARARLREDLLVRLGEAAVRTAPGGAFTAAVLAALAPRAAEAAAGAGIGLGLAASLPKGAAVAALALAAGLALLLATRGGPGGGPPSPATVTVARPPEARDPAAPRTETRRLAGAEADAAGWLAVRVTGDGAPLRGAKVRAYLRLPVEPGTGRAAWRLGAEGGSGEGGLVRLPAAPGAWLVAAAATGFAPVQVAVVRPAGEEATPVEVALSLPRALSGRTVDRAGQAVPLAAVGLSRVPDGAPAGTPLPPEEERAAVSDGRGTFAVEGLAPGRWRLTAEAAGHARAVVEDVRVPASGPVEVVLDAAGLVEGQVIGADGRPAAGAEVLLAGGPELLRVEAGPRGGFAAEVQPGSYRLSARLGDRAGWLDRPVAIAAGGAAKGLTIALGAPARFVGRVEEEDGRPVPAAVVVVSPCNGAGEVWRAETGADGRFEAGPLAPGEYDLDAAAGGHTPAGRSGLVLLAGQRFDVTLRIAGTGAVAGRVTDPSGAPVAGARVKGGRRWAAGFGQGPAEAVTDAGGLYRLEGLEVGPAFVRAGRAGALLGAQAPVTIEPGVVATVDLTLPAFGEVEGTLRRDDGQPLPAGLRVAIGPDRMAWTPEEVVHPEVGADGRFRATLPAGGWSVVGSDGSPRLSGRSRFEVAAESLARVEVVLRAGNWVIRIHEPGGAPAAGAMVQATAGQALQVMTTASELGEASFTLQPPAAGEAWPLVVSARRGGRQALNVPLARDAMGGDVQLLPGARLAGRVDGGAVPVRGFDLRLELPRLPLRTLDDGLSRQFSGDRFELSDVPSGAVRLVVTTDDGRAGQADVELRGGEAAEVAVAVAAPGRVRARAVDAQGRPVPGASLSAGGGGLEWEPPGAGLAPAGGLEAGGLPPGRGAVELRARCHAPVRREFTLQPGETLDLGDVVLAPLPGACPR